MSVVTRRADAVDALEHAMQGVQTDDRDDVGVFGRNPGLMSTTSETRVCVGDDTKVEPEVTVVRLRLPHRHRPR
jgi:hypothetical protein